MRPKGTMHHSQSILCAPLSSSIRGREERGVLIGAAGLTNADSSGIGGKSVTKLRIICAKTNVRPAATLVHGEWAFITPGNSQIHGLVIGGRRLVARGGRQREGTGRGKASGWLGGGVGAGEGCGGLFLFD